MNEGQMMELMVKGLITEMEPDQQERVKTITAKVDEIFQPLYDGQEDEALMVAAVMLSSKLSKVYNK